VGGIGSREGSPAQASTQTGLDAAALHMSQEGNHTGDDADGTVARITYDGCVSEKHPDEAHWCGHHLMLMLCICAGFAGMMTSLAGS
jgi:hypothetical protein